MADCSVQYSSGSWTSSYTEYDTSYATISRPGETVFFTSAAVSTACPAPTISVDGNSTLTVPLPCSTVTSFVTSSSVQPGGVRTSAVVSSSVGTTVLYYTTPVATICPSTTRTPSTTNTPSPTTTTTTQPVNTPTTTSTYIPPPPVQSSVVEDVVTQPVTSETITSMSTFYIVVTDNGSLVTSSGTTAVLIPTLRAAQDHSKSNVGAIAGGVVGGLLALLLIMLGVFAWWKRIWCCGARRRDDNDYDDAIWDPQHSPVEKTTPGWQANRTINEEGEYADYADEKQDEVYPQTYYSPVQQQPEYYQRPQPTLNRNTSHASSMILGHRQMSSSVSSCYPAMANDSNVSYYPPQSSSSHEYYAVPPQSPHSPTYGVYPAVVVQKPRRTLSNSSHGHVPLRSSGEDYAYYAPRNRSSIQGLSVPRNASNSHLSTMTYASNESSIQSPVTPTFEAPQSPPLLPKKSSLRLVNPTLRTSSEEEIGTYMSESTNPEHYNKEPAFTIQPGQVGHKRQSSALDGDVAWLGSLAH